MAKLIFALVLGVFVVILAVYAIGAVIIIVQPEAAEACEVHRVILPVILRADVYTLPVAPFEINADGGGE